ncbi:A-kinase-interacting protein 1 isoform 2-T3 [Menidia menidia]
MASQAWLESSLKRSARLGLEVLERASRRTVVWTDTSRPQTPIPSDEDAQRTHSELSDAFTAIAELMAQTTHHCKRFYESGCSEPSDIERTHVSRFHVSPEAQRTRSPSTGNQENTQETEKIFVPRAAFLRQGKSFTSRCPPEPTRSLPACQIPSSRPSWSP